MIAQARDSHFADELLSMVVSLLLAPMSREMCVQ